MSIQSTYEIILRSKIDGGILRRLPMRETNTLGGLYSFNYWKRLRTAASSVVRIWGNDPVLQFLLLTDPLKNVDNYWEFRRSDPLNTERGFYTDYSTFHRGENTDYSANGRLLYVSNGQGMNALTQSETIDYPSGTAQALKNTDAAQAAFQYVDENIGANAGNDLDGFSRVRPNLAVAPVASSGFNYNKDNSGEQLIDVLNKIADYSNAEFNIEGTIHDGMIFNWRQAPYGEDRRKGNTAGNAPVIFDAQRGNITNVKTNINYLNAVTSVSVAGSGSGIVRKRTNVNDPAQLAYSNWARRTVSRTDNQQPDISGLEELGEGVIRSNDTKILMSFTYRQTEQTRYGRDFDVGDLVTGINNFGVENDYLIRGMGVAYSLAGEELLKPEMEQLTFTV